MDTIDDIGRRAAATVHAEAAAIADVDSMFDELAAMAGSAPRPRRRDRTASPPGRPRRWAVLGAAAAVAAAVVVGIVVVAARDPHARVVPAPSVPPSPVPTSPVETTEPPPTQPSTSAPTASLPAATVAPSTGEGLAVSYKNPPPFLEPQMLGTVELTDADIGNGLTVMETGVVVVDGTRATTLAWDGSTRSVDITIDFDFTGLIMLGAGPGEMLYLAATGVDQTNMTAATIVAIPLSGSRAGQVVATTPADVNRMIERPAAWVGHGPTGLIDREGLLQDEMVRYVDEQGDPWPEALAVREYRKDADVVLNIDGSQSWNLQIDRPWGSSDGFNGPPLPTPAPGGGAVWWDTIGPPAGGGDFPPGTIPVIAFLGADGTATWRQIPSDWGVVASDVWGTVIASIEGTTMEVALATPNVGPAPAASPAEATMTTYLTSLAARDYEAAAMLLGNDGLSLTERPDLAPLRTVLAANDDDLADALRQWCEDPYRAACWMPSNVTEQTGVGNESRGTAIVVAAYDGFNARFVVGSWEGQPTVFGLPPLADYSGVERARQLLGVEALYAPAVAREGDPYRLVLTSNTGSENLAPPPGRSGASAVTPDGYAIAWTSGDPMHTTVTDTNGAVLCDVDEQVLELVGEPGAYRAIVTREGPGGPPDAPEPEPAFEIDCATGVETPTDPWTWNGGPVYARKYVAGERTFISQGTDHGGELADDAGAVISGGDNVFSVPAFNADGTIVAYGAHTGSANPWLATHVIARDTATGDLLWDTELNLPVNAVWVTDDRVLVETGVAASNDQFGTAGLTLIDLTTGEVMLSVPTAFNILYVE